ncbi:ParB/RepB/Spo0J family partition protein [Mesorhizobium sp. 1M-11]|uniref:ParB/RepB/Spo0J family partition protein n=1 Tax=Mesorhizobium sp. 1M-11 TaxID=1529006 RepID=UPI0006C74C8D|nr:ParB/RepB/Spo0J family partition protein [Mesorhizobium sp. 1M-11]
MSDINIQIGEKPDLEWVRIDRIDVDRNYQRPLKPRLVKKILAKFAWRKFGAVVLSRQEGGRYTIVEGQHRWKAASLHPNVTEIPAIVVEHADTADEAGSFLAINRDRQAVTSVEQYWAGLTAGDEWAMAVSRVLQAANCDVVPEPGHYRPNLTASIGAIDRCLKRYGHGATRRALLVIRAAWPDDSKSLRGTLITALARIIRANDKTINEADLANALRRESFAKLTAHAEAFRKLSGGSSETALSKALVEIYNKGKRVNQIVIGAQL